MTDFYDMVHKYSLRKAIVDFDQSRSSSDPTQQERIRSENIQYHEANAISSLIIDGPNKGLHLPVLDIDLDCCVVPSSTPGNHHLVIGKPMTFEDYTELMAILRDVEILEPGYVAAAERRKETWIRTPWTRK